MRRRRAIALALAVCAALASGATSARGGDYHAGDSLVCGECHDGARTPVRSGINALCLSCHGTSKRKAPLVTGTSRAGTARQAGALNGIGSSLPHATGHTLGAATPAPGGVWAPGPGGLACTDCHAAHGDPAQYRNLVLRPGTASGDRRVSYVVAPADDRTKDVWIRSSRDTLGRFASENVRFNQPDPGRSAYAEWCQGCHTDSMEANSPRKGDGVRDRAWLRHPTSGITIGADGDRHSSFVRWASLPNGVQTLSASGRWPSPDNVVSCMSCHKAHGNRNPFGLLYAAGRGEPTEEGDTGGSRLEDTCHQCHVEGTE
jgi:hypothetical protein